MPDDLDDRLARATQRVVNSLTPREREVLQQRFNRPAIQARSQCALCAAPTLVEVLRLPASPLANAFQPAREAALALPRYPLVLQACQACGHIQLQHVVPPEELFSEYLYTSPPSMSAHWQEYAKWCVDRLQLKVGDLVVEIGSNDGALLMEFQKLGMRVVGVEPGRKVADLARARGVPTVSGYWCRDAVEAIVADHGTISLVCANNVLAHVPDLHAVFGALTVPEDTTCTDWSGHDRHPTPPLVFEVQYVKDLLDGKLLDMVYHEHMHYHAIRPLWQLAEAYGGLRSVHRVSTHGGSIRCVVGGPPPRTPKPEDLATLTEMMAEETADALPSKQSWSRLQMQVHLLPSPHLGLAKTLADERNAGRKVIGFGAPAKSTTLLMLLEGRLPVTAMGPRGMEEWLQAHSQPLDYPLDYLVDDSALKQGLFTPGTGLEIKPVSALEAEDPAKTTVLLLAWNLREQIVERLRPLRERGLRILVPLPVQRTLNPGDAL